MPWSVRIRLKNRARIIERRQALYTYDNFHKVKQLIEERGAEARRTSELRSAELRAMSPEIAEIDAELRGTGMLIFKTACEGGDIDAVKSRNRELVSRRRKIIKSLGYPEDYADVKYCCPECKDSGFLENTKMCSCFKTLLVTENIKSSGMGSLIERQSFENFNLGVYAYDAELYRRMEYILSESRKFADSFSRSRGANKLLFVGNTGTGKTHISTSIAKRLIERGYDVLYETTQNIISSFENDRFRSGYGPHEPEADKYMECDLLIMDDLGTEFVNQFTVSCLYNLINTRHNKGLSTIISTNLSPKELAAKYDDRIYSRIVGEGTVVYNFGGKDYRLFGG